MKVCIIGNSHTGALKRAWDTFFDSNFKNIFDLTFFASRAQRLEGLKIEGTKLIPQNEYLKENLKFTSGGKPYVDLSLYDVFLVYGLSTRPYFLSKVFYSEAVLIKSIEDNHTSSLSFKILTMIRDVVDTKTFIGHDPLRVNKDRDGIEFDKVLTEQYSLGISLVNESLFFPLGAELLEQPQQTIVGKGRNTHSIYSKGSKRLDVGDEKDGELHPESDNRHMNDEFGKIWLESFLGRLKSEL
ncbi:MAG: hypothetical protein C0617_13265 [Desulfuromonas sp.]|uniref:hypothetical protein n=1 Tax=Desulfuromonas sp. TaxID=892 RepID=UPI000CB86B2A|nr:hypothetical protein [Desulfuromonas sp.]PLX82835.1 MAG: hypothetical protein C0617_13265 [Desulfuromonas sp.]